MKRWEEGEKEIYSLKKKENKKEKTKKKRRKRRRKDGGCGARWRAGHRGAPAHRRQGRWRSAFVAGRKTERE